MKLYDDFYEIERLDATETGLLAAVKINKDHPIFKGHFPNHPVTPGVCTMQIIKELTEKRLGLKLFLKHARNIKFMAIINPQLNNSVQVDLQIAHINEHEFDVKGTVLMEDNPALKFGGIFSKK